MPSASLFPVTSLRSQSDLLESVVSMLSDRSGSCLITMLGRARQVSGKRLITTEGSSLSFKIAGLRLAME